MFQLKYKTKAAASYIQHIDINATTTRFCATKHNRDNLKHIDGLMDVNYGNLSDDILYLWMLKYIIYIYMYACK